MVKGDGLLLENLHCIVLASKDIWEPDFEGVFLHSNSRLLFAHRRGKSIVITTIEGGEDEEKVIETIEADLPAYWILVNKGTILMHSEHYCIDLHSMQSRAVTDIFHRQEYKKNVVLCGQHLVSDDFDFGDYKIAHYKECGLICKRAGEQRWRINCRGYLYTDILLFHDCVLFGTAGMGGHFYAIELSTGEIKCDVNTGGTGYFILSGDIVYLLSRGKNSKVLAISADTWRIQDEITIGGKVSSYSRLALECNRLYAVSFQYKDKLPVQAQMNVINVGSRGMVPFSHCIQ